MAERSNGWIHILVFLPSFECWCSSLPSVISSICHSTNCHSDICHKTMLNGVMPSSIMPNEMLPLKPDNLRLSQIKWDHLIVIVPLHLSIIWKFKQSNQSCPKPIPQILFSFSFQPFFSSLSKLFSYHFCLECMRSSLKNKQTI